MALNEDFWIPADPAPLLVRVKRHHAARRLRLRWDATVGELRLTLPPRHRLSSARTWVGEQSAWIARQRSVHPGGRVAVGPGIVLPVNGDDIEVRWSVTASRVPRLDNGTLLIGGPAERVAPRIARWLATQALADYSARTTKLAGDAGLSFSKIAVGDARRRWGSCSSAGVLRFSWRLMMAPPFVRQALVAHEVAHLAHLDHSQRFRDLEQQLGGGDVAASRLWLRREGSALHRFDFTG
jgi:predicted metal-dependent hydrolase